MTLRPPSRHMLQLGDGPRLFMQRRKAGALEGPLLLPMQTSNRRLPQTRPYFSALADGLELDAVLRARVLPDRFF